MRAKYMLIVCMMVASVAFPACKKHGTAAPDAALAMPEVRDDSPNLLFTWVTDDGAFTMAERAEDVPPTVRDAVRVASAMVPDPDPDTVFVADMRVRRADGTYTVVTMGRASFDRTAVERRKTRATAAEAASGEGDQAVIYGASWCGPCHQAQAWFKGAGIAFVDHDIEEDPAARAEMQAALERVGRGGGSIPVIVWRGKVFVGFDQRGLEAMRSAGP